MTYFYTLHFDTEAEAFATAESLGLLPYSTMIINGREVHFQPDELPGNIVISHPGIFGQAQAITDAQVPGTYDPETGEELSPPRPIPGVFLNVCLSRNALPSDLRLRRVPYGSGGQVFAGTEPDPQAWPPAES